MSEKQFTAAKSAKTTKSAKHAKAGMQAGIFGISWKAFGVSAGLHVVMILVFAISMAYTPAPNLQDSPMLSTPDVDIVEAVAVDEAQVQAQVERLQQERDAQRRAEEQRVAELERRAREAEQLRQREAERAAQVQRDRERQERERQQAEAQARQAREEAQRAEREREQAAERLRQQQEQERQAEAERQRREQERLEAERQARERAERERQLQERLAEEQAARNRARQQRVLTEVERYQALIRQTIQRNWIVDSSMRGKSCILNISLASTGFVTNVTVGEGDRAVCESARAAVLRAGSLPMSDDPDVAEQLRNIRLRVEPQL